MSQYASDEKLVSFKVYVGDQAEFVTSDVEYILVIDFIDTGKNPPELGEVFKRVSFDDSVPALQGGSGVLVRCLGFPNPFLTDHMHPDPPSLVHERQLYISFRDTSTKDQAQPNNPRRRRRGALRAMQRIRARFWAE
jgi:hypothetical protein